MILGFWSTCPFKQTKPICLPLSETHQPEFLGTHLAPGFTLRFKLSERSIEFPRPTLWHPPNAAWPDALRYAWEGPPPICLTLRRATTSMLGGRWGGGIDMPYIESIYIYTHNLNLFYPCNSSYPLILVVYI